jgi:hypothetical protein
MMTLEHRAILAPFISQGRVDYAAVQRSLDLKSLLADIAEHDLSDSTRDEQLAFYLNAYNLLTLHQVLECIRRDSNWPGPVSLLQKLHFFMGMRHSVAGSKMNLITLENGVIRRRFREPRIHFALNCASTSCPHLAGALFRADTLESDLEHLAAQFIRSEEVRYDPSANLLTVSPLFKWYRRDFAPSVQGFIAR